MKRKIFIENAPNNFYFNYFENIKNTNTIDVKNNPMAQTEDGFIEIDIEKLVINIKQKLFFIDKIISIQAVSGLHHFCLKFDPNDYFSFAELNSPVYVNLWSNKTSKQFMALINGYSENNEEDMKQLASFSEIVPIPELNLEDQENGESSFTNDVVVLNVNGNDLYLDFPAYEEKEDIFYKLNGEELSPSDLKYTFTERNIYRRYVMPNCVRQMLEVKMLFLFKDDSNNCKNINKFGENNIFLVDYLPINKVYSIIDYSKGKKIVIPKRDFYIRFLDQNDKLINMNFTIIFSY